MSDIMLTILNMDLDGGFEVPNDSTVCLKEVDELFHGRHVQSSRAALYEYMDATKRGR